jgi:Gamma-glutamyl cyclotransferase, AIG2-like
MAIVFQYGSNMSEERLNSFERLNGSAQKIGIAYSVDNFEFDFTIWSKKNNCASSDLIPNKGRNIWGVLYSIPDERVYRTLCVKGKTCLDQIEGEGKNYERQIIKVLNINDNNNLVEAVTYFVKNKVYGLLTSIEYASYILYGLKSNKIPAEYIEYIISRIKNNNPGILKFI